MTASWRTREELAHQVVTLARARHVAARDRARSRRQPQHGPSGARRARARAREPSTSRCRRGRRARRAPTKVDAFEAARRGAARDASPTSPRSASSRSCATRASTGGYTAVKKHVREVRPPTKPDAQPDDAGLRPRRDGRERLVALRDAASRRARRPIVQALSYVLVVQQAQVLRALREQRPARADGRARRSPSRASTAARTRASTTARSPSCCAGRATSPSTIRASSRSRSPLRVPPARRAPRPPQRQAARRSASSGRSSAPSSTAASSATSTTCAPSSRDWLDTHRRPSPSPTSAPRSSASPRRSEHLVPLPRHPLRHRARRLPRLQHRRLRRLGRQSLRRPLRPRHRHPARPHHAARALRLRRRPRAASRATSSLRAAQALKLDPAGLHPPPAAQEPDRPRSAPRRLRATWASAPPTSSA